MSRPLNIVFLTVADLPEGMGHTARLRTFVETLTDLDHRVTIWNEHAMSDTSGQTVRGTLGGAPFEYVLGTVERKYGFQAIPLKVRAVLIILRKLSRAHRDRRIDLIILNSLSFYDILPITNWARLHRILTIQCYEDDRMELVSKERLGLARRLFGVNAWLADRCCSTLADAIIVISHYLKAKYDSLTRDSSRVHVIPPIIDCEEWRIPNESVTDCPKLLYTGSLAEQDELEGVIEALDVLKRNGLRFSALILGAESSNPRTKQLRDLIESRDLGDRVELRGYVPVGVVKRELANSNILLALRRDTVWAQSGQSTKLSEYLASGRIVITTPVGDNERYLDDGKSALFVSCKLDRDEIVSVMERAMVQPELRAKIGAAGRHVAEMNFDKEIVRSRLNEILNLVDEVGEKSGKR
jgi:glycosyltransferase involved in cell wall biosynthesis